MELSTFEDKIIEIDEAIIRLRKDGIIHITFKDQTELDTTLQDRLIKIYIELAGKNKRLFLFTAFSDVSITKEAREHAIELESIYPALATAIVADNLAYKLIANFYLKINRPKTPYKIFKTIEEAEEWLKTFMQ